MIKLGKIGFANCDLPYYAIEQGIIPLENVEIVESHPVDLARKIQAGTIDISPISSIMYPQIDDLLILPHINIASDNFTKSVLVCSECTGSLEELQNKTLCLPDVSASSATLIQIILKLKGINVNIKHCPGQDVEDMIQQGDAALFIGDRALRASHRYRVISDLGGEWRRLTGKKMVYALWVVRRELAEERPEEVEYVHSRLIESKNYSYQHMEEIAAVISREKHFTSKLMQDYLHNLDYELDRESIESLTTYYQYAKQYGFIQQTKELIFFKPEGSSAHLQRFEEQTTL
jgi:chorismate dehydratase